MTAIKRGKFENYYYASFLLNSIADNNEKRNALVRANYNNLKLGIRETTEYLELFMKNLLLNKKNQLSNRKMHIHSTVNDQKIDIEAEKIDIDNQKVDIEAEKANICARYGLNYSGFSKKTIDHIHMLYKEYGEDRYFGRTDLNDLLGLILF